MNQRIERSIILGLAGIIVLTLTLGYITYRSNTIYQNTFYLIKHTQQVLYLSEHTANNLRELESRERAYVVTGDSAYLESFDLLRRDLMNHLSQLRALTINKPSQQAKLDSIDAFTKQKLWFMKGIIELRADSGFIRASALAKTKKGLIFMNEIDQVIQKFQQEEGQLLNKREAAYNESSRRFTLLFAIQSLVLVMAMVVFSILIIVSFRRRRKALTELNENKKLLQSIIDRTTSIIFVVDTGGHYILVNEACQKYSAAKETMIGKTAFDIFSLDTAKRWDETRREVMASGRHLEMEYEINHDGKMMHSYTVLFPLFDEGGAIHAVCGIATDITPVIHEQELIRQKQMAAIAIEAQEKQRAEIGRELHDNVQQMLVTTGLMLDTALWMPELQQQCLDKAKHYVATVVKEIRNLSHTLMPPSFNEKTFSETIEDIVDDLNFTGSIKAEVTISSPEAIDALSEKVQLTLYRITQEQVSNVLKYSKANRIKIRLGKKGRKIYLTINDNGQGFDAATTPQGIGFKNMANRAELLNGTLKITSSPGKGCYIATQIPV